MIPAPEKRWSGPVVVAAPGPSIDIAPLWLVEGRYPTIAVGDAYRRLPRADILYACDEKWWNARDGAAGFAGEKWSSTNADPDQGNDRPDDKRACAERWGLTLVPAYNMPGRNQFLTDGGICYGDNSGFQAIGLSILLGAQVVFLIGFDMRLVNERAHFFGNHGERDQLFQGDYEAQMDPFRQAAGKVPPGIVIMQCTPDSKLKEVFGYWNPYDVRCIPSRV